MLAHLLFRSAGLPARDNFRRPCVYHYPVDRRSSQNYFFTFCSVSLYGFQGTMLSVPLFAFRFPATAPLLYHPSSPLSTLFSLPRLPRLFSVFSFISFTFLYFSLHSSNKYIKILAEYLLFFIILS